MTSTPALTPRQQEVLDFIAAYRRMHGYAPTMQEIADDFGISKPGAYEHVGALVEKGKLRREKNRARMIELVEPIAPKSKVLLKFPIIGTIGKTIEIGGTPS